MYGMCVMIGGHCSVHSDLLLPDSVKRCREYICCGNCEIAVGFTPILTIVNLRTELLRLSTHLDPHFLGNAQKLENQVSDSRR